MIETVERTSSLVEFLSSRLPSEGDTALLFGVRSVVPFEEFLSFGIYPTCCSKEDDDLLELEGDLLERQVRFDSVPLEGKPLPHRYIYAMGHVTAEDASLLYEYGRPSSFFLIPTSEAETSPFRHFGLLEIYATSSLTVLFKGPDLFLEDY